MGFLHLLARGCAYVGGIILAAVALVVVTSIVGRTLFGRAVTGDYEWVQIGCAVAVSLCLPLCQAERGNIIVDFFTVAAGERVKQILDALGAVLLAMTFAVLGIRAGYGGMSLLETGDSMTLLRFYPQWVNYFVLMPGLLLAAVVAFVQAVLIVGNKQHDE